MAQGRVVWVASKTPGNPDAVAWNVARGGRFDNVRWDQWPLKAIRVARDAFLLSSLDFGGVDIMVDAQNNAYVLEINSAPSQTSPYRQEATAKAFDYIVNYGKDRIDVTEEKGGWRKFIHPAISNEAIMV
jgi:glutathione synthase/RimK-type ligase-like ATP-grasp enzyme